MSTITSTTKTATVEQIAARITALKQIKTGGVYPKAAISANFKARIAGRGKTLEDQIKSVFFDGDAMATRETFGIELYYDDLGYAQVDFYDININNATTVTPLNFLEIAEDYLRGYLPEDFTEYCDPGSDDSRLIFSYLFGVSGISLISGSNRGFEDLSTAMNIDEIEDIFLAYLKGEDYTAKTKQEMRADFARYSTEIVARHKEAFNAFAAA